MNLKFLFIRLKFKLISFISPEKASEQALYIFQHPHFQKIRDRERKFLEHSKIIRIPYDPEDIILYNIGNPEGQKILMIHGWDSNPGSMAAIADKLSESGFNVYVFNVPAHGISEQKTTNMLYVSQIMMDLIKELGDNISVVTHSFGSGAISFALAKSKAKIDKIAFITSPDKLYDIFLDFANRIGLNNKAFNLMLKFTEEKFHYTFEEMQISKLLNKANYNKLLLIHDKNDMVLPFKNSEVIANSNKNTELFVTHDKGHYRILWDDEVINKVNDFIKS